MNDIIRIYMYIKKLGADYRKIKIMTSVIIVS